MEAYLIIEGLKFMVLGMGTVFAFLVIMIACMNIMSSVIHKYFPEPQASTDAPASTSEQKDNKKIVAAITAAIAHHRQG